MHNNIELKKLVMKLKKMNYSSDTIIKIILCKKKDDAINLIEKNPNIEESEFIRILKV